MRILYIAKHHSRDNDDEGAVAYALEQLGHEVIKVQEFGNLIAVEDTMKLDQEFAFCLFHKWSNFDFIKRLKCPKIFWYFDLVDWPGDPTLASRCEARKKWMAQVTPLVDLGFCTDGDWQAKDITGKLHVLRQGADERVVGLGCQGADVLKLYDVLFVGGVKGCGAERESFVQELREQYGEKFLHVDKGVYRLDLADLVARSKVVVCPDSPVTDRYWSNRIYVMAGFGACLLHPRVSERVVPGVITYGDRRELFGHIDDLLKLPEDRKKASEVSLKSVKDGHLYRHRCEELVRAVKDKLGI